MAATRRRWWVIVLLAVIGAGLAAAPETKTVREATRVVRTYEATHTMLVNDTAGVTGSEVSPGQVNLFAKVGEVPQRVADLLDYDGNIVEFANQIEVNYDAYSGALTFSTSQPTAERAELVADTWANETNAYLLERQDEVYNRRLTLSDERVDELTRQLDRVTALLGISPDDPTLLAERDALSRQYSQAYEQSETVRLTPPVLGFTTLQSAQAYEITTITGGSQVNSPTSRPVRAAMGGIVGTVIGLAIAIVLGWLDRRIRTREQAEEILGMRARVMVPKFSDHNQGGLVAITGRHDQLSDSYRTLRNVVSFLQNGLDLDRGPVTLVVSPGPGDGKTVIAANLAAALVETGDPTIVVNTDYRRPRLSKAVRSERMPPHPFEYDDLARIQPSLLLFDTDVEGLRVLDLSSIEATPGELTRASARLTPALSGLADRVVIDTSPVGATAEVLDLVPYADTIVIAVRLGHTQIDVAARTIAVLRDLTNVPMILVLTHAKQTRATYYDYTDRTDAAAAEAKKSGKRRRRDKADKRDKGADATGRHGRRGRRRDKADKVGRRGRRDKADKRDKGAEATGRRGRRREPV